ncbi:MAG: NAD(P)-binding protein [Actinobacteria bacterium]|nr:NAD(P)-binding protein [Actinomycetota bacterium]
MSQHIAVIGSGVGGLTAALALGRAGHRVTVLERDRVPHAADPDEAFAADRHGAPQVHQTHGFLARLQVVLRDRFPDVLDAVLEAGATTMPTTADFGEPEAGDDDLRVLIMRRTTLEWVLRQKASEQDGVEIRAGVGVSGLVGAPRRHGGIPAVSGVHLDDGTELAADLVVASNGRRAPLPQWLGELGVHVPETVHESGLMYLSRWYRWTAGLDGLDPKLGGDLGFVKFLGVPGDGDTLSITLAIASNDADLRRALADPARFDLTCQLLPGPNQFFARGPIEPLGDVRPMAGLLNRVRRFLDENGQPTVLGFHAIGDAHTCTNPLYGRGCALATVQATLLADSLDAHPDDPAARAAMYEAACEREVEPWFHSAVQLDAMGADLNEGAAAPTPEAAAMGAVFAAAATDPVIGRGIARCMNLLMTPSELMSDPAFLARAVTVMANPDDFPLPERHGPTRAELLDSLGSVAA